jgi:hypothetical protein
MIINILNRRRFMPYPESTKVTEGEEPVEDTQGGVPGRLVVEIDPSQLETTPEEIRRLFDEAWN